jgi:hypothetical protein
VFLRSGSQVLSRFHIEGFTVTRVHGHDYRACDLAVVFGVPNPLRHSALGTLRNRIYAKHAGPILVVESSILGRQFVPRRLPLLGRLLRQKPKQVHGQYRLAVGGAFGPAADFNNQNSPPDRWQRLAIEIKPYRTAGNTIVLLGQIENDASLGGRSAVGWLIETAATIRQSGDRPIVIRLHPSLSPGYVARVRESVKAIGGVTVSPLGRPMAEDLADAHVSVSISSGSAIESMIAGVPAITLSPDSLAYRICSRSLVDLECPATPAREQWLYDLAYAQWSLEEFADGTAWRHIEPAIHRAMTADAARRRGEARAAATAISPYLG